MVPGISGGTMALLFGIYYRLIDAIRSFDAIWIKSIVHFDIYTVLRRPHFSFLIPLTIGILSAVLFFTKVISLPFLIRNYPENIYGLFFGLILGSSWVLMQESKLPPWKKFQFTGGGIITGLLIFTATPVTTPDTGWFLFISGLIAVSAMLLPGISGSFILLILKKYAYILEAIGQFNLAVITPFVLGIITGLILVSRLLHYLLNRWYQQVSSLIIGLLITSLLMIWPFQQRIYKTIDGKENLIALQPYLPTQLTISVNITIAMILAGLSLILIIRRLSKQPPA